LEIPEIIKEPVNQQQLLPENYYAENFREVLNSVLSGYDSILSDSEKQFGVALNLLSEDAFKLYARLVNRTPLIFRLSKLNYPAINSISDASSELGKFDFIQKINEENLAQFCQDILQCFTVKELKLAFAGALPRDLISRADVCGYISEHEEKREMLAILLSGEPLIRCEKKELWRYYRFLFFGELYSDLSAFVIYELGHVAVEKKGNLKTLFKFRKEVDDCYNLALFYEEFRNIRETETVEFLWAWYQSRNIYRTKLCETAWPVYDRFADKFGRLLERNKRFSEAQILYLTSPASPCRERLAKLYQKQEELNKAKELCIEIIEKPNDAEEHYAASQLLNRINKTSKRSQARELLSTAEIIHLDYREEYVENAVIAHYSNQGWNAVHSENWLWNSLFGLCFWDIIFNDEQGFHHPFQFGPSDLYRGFYINRKELIDARIPLLENKTARTKIINACFKNKSGIANPFISWHDDLPALIKNLLSVTPPHGIAGILKEMVRDLKNNRKGFPDLFLWKKNEYRFIEVKSENDQLSAQQYYWLNLFNKNGVVAEVVRVKLL